MVDTKSVEDRRKVHYKTFDELRTDAQRLAESDVRTLGNWSYGQILRHLAKSINAMIDGVPFAFPAPLQWALRLLMKKKFLTKPMSPGFKLPKKAGALLPEETSVEDGMAELRAAIDRANSESKRAPNGALGRMTKEECDQFQLRHAELHMSFVVAK